MSQLEPPFTVPAAWPRAVAGRGRVAGVWVQRVVAGRAGAAGVRAACVLGVAFALALLGCGTGGPALGGVEVGGPLASTPASVSSIERISSPLPPAEVAPAPPEPPVPPERPPLPPRRPGAYANLDPDDDLIVGPPDELADCDAQLAAAGVTFRRATLTVHVPKRSKVVCGSPQVVTYLKGPGNLAYSSPPLLTCGMALALASFERIVQEEARRVFRSPVARIEHVGTYACREIAAYPGWVSEHSYANAIDLSRFVLKNGRALDVLHDFDVGAAEPKKPGGVFLRAISRRANDEDVFSHVLTPFFNAGHKNHFHLDLARFRADGTRPAPAPIGELQRPSGGSARHS